MEMSRFKPGIGSRAANSVLLRPRRRSPISDTAPDGRRRDHRLRVRRAGRMRYESGETDP
jgi:hypothetical protein